MPTTKRIVCLANSRKLNGRCIAGLEIVPGKLGGWLRPVSAREKEEISEYERQYQDGSDPRVLDIIDVPLLDPRPKTYQSENWLIEPNTYWVKVGQASWGKLVPYATKVAPLWIMGNHTRIGLNDQIAIDEAVTLKSSLQLVHVSKLELRVFAPNAVFGNSKRRVLGEFTHGGFEYMLWVTDPIIEREYLLKEDGNYSLPECLLTVSLGEPLNGFVYKLIAAVILQPMSKV